MSEVLVIAITVWRGWLAPATDERTGVRWLGLGLLWTVIALAVGASSLATVVIGLPNDHYHAFADPMVVVLVGVGVAALIRRAAASTAETRLVPAGAAAAPSRRDPRLECDAPAAGHGPGRWLAGGRGGRGADPRRHRGRSRRARQPAGGEVRRCRPVPAGAPGAGQCRREAAAAAPRRRGRRASCCATSCSTRRSARTAAARPRTPRSASSSADRRAPPTLLDRFEAAPGRWVSVYRLTTRDGSVPRLGTRESGGVSRQIGHATAFVAPGRAGKAPGSTGASAPEGA